LLDWVGITVGGCKKAYISCIYYIRPCIDTLILAEK